MGKAARWFRNILGKKDQTGKKQDQPPPPPTNAKRWSFGKSSRDSAEAAAAAAAAVGGNAAIARAAEAAWHRSAAAAYGETDREREQSKHAIAVAAATAAAADAAVAAAQAAVAVVRLTSKGRAVAAAPVLATTAAGAAVRIQTAFRGFLAKKALRALKALVKLQALVRGYLVRKQTAATLHSMHALIRAQAAARAHRTAAGVLPHQLHLPPLIRPRFSLQERYADDTRSEHGAAYGSRRMSASIESSSYGYDRSPKIVEVDPGRPKSRSSSRRTSAPPLADASAGEECWSTSNSISSPLPCYFAAGPPRIAVPTSRNFPDHDWCAPEKARPATAQSTPRYVAPPTPTKSVAGGYSPSLNGSNSGSRGYMSSTQSSEAKSRSQSAPKQRPPEARKRVPLSEVVVVESSRASLTGAVGMHRSSCTGGRTAQQQQHEAFTFKAAVVGRMDRMLEVAGENDRLAFLQRRW